MQNSMEQTTVLNDLAKITRRVPATETLLIAAPDKLLELRKQLNEQYTDLNINQLRLSSSCKYKQVIIWQPSQYLSKDKTTHLLSKLRDQISECVYVCESIKNDPIYNSDIYHHLQSLGFLLLEQYSNKDSLFYFDIYDYKRIPDWLNSRFWANPERWGKERW